MFLQFAGQYGVEQEPPRIETNPAAAASAPPAVEVHPPGAKAAALNNLGHLPRSGASSSPRGGGGSSSPKGRFAGTCDSCGEKFGPPPALAIHRKSCDLSPGRAPTAGSAAPAHEYKDDPAEPDERPDEREALTAPDSRDSLASPRGAGGQLYRTISV